MLQGSCLCGGVRYEISGRLGPGVHCHCGQCRKASGSSFATNASVSSGEFRFVSGESLVGEFESSPGQFRRFCTRCGSPLVKRNTANPDELRLRLGTLDTDPELRMDAHILVRFKAPWTEIRDDLPQRG
jgi:hypothetical protein